MIGQAQPRRGKFSIARPPRNAVASSAPGAGPRCGPSGHRSIGRRDQIARRIGNRPVQIENDRVAHLLSVHGPVSAAFRVCL
jgi:hypothetical protein